MADLTNQATHDYLKVIFEICEREGRAGTGRIADELGVTPASVTGMLKKMAGAEPPLLDYRKHQGVKLTDAGEKLALETIRRHRLLECFLHDALGYSWDEVHEEADRLEHAISGAFGRKIADLLEHPERDPHGAPIPSPDLELAQDHSAPLEEMPVGQRVRVQRVDDRDSELLRYLADIDLVPGAELNIITPLPFSDHLRIQYCGHREPINISRRVAAGVFVEVIEELEAID